MWANFHFEGLAQPLPMLATASWALSLAVGPDITVFPLVDGGLSMRLVNRASSSLSYIVCLTNELMKAKIAMWTSVR